MTIEALQLSSEDISGTGNLYAKTLTRSYATTGVIGRYTGMNISTEYAANYGYDGYGRLNSVSNGTDTFSYGYLSNSNLVSSVTRPGSLTTAYSYEDHRNLVTAVENKYDTTTISAYGYVNDAIGRRTSMSRTGTAFSITDSLTYGYNDRSEVTSAVSNNITTYNYAFSFDNIGNRLSHTSYETGTPVSTSYTSNNLNQYTAVNTINPAYNDDGCMTNDGTWTFTWNAENQLAKAEKADQKLEFTYDYLGRRVEKKVYSGSSGNWVLNTHLRFVYDNFKCVEVLDALNENVNTVTQKFLWIDEALLAVNDVAASATYYYFTDVNKNIGQLMDGSGNIVAKYEYSPSGKQTLCSGSYADANPFRFSSEYFDSETNLVYYNYRYYSPELGRWLSRDPIEEEGGLNIYSMLGNDPVNYWDDLGLSERGDGYDVEKNAQEYNKIIGQGEQNFYDMAKWDATTAVEAGLWFAPIGRIGEFVSRVSKAAWGPISRTIGKICGKCGGKAAGTAEAVAKTGKDAWTESKIMATQKGGIDSSKVSKIKDDMLNGTYNYSSPEGRIGGYKTLDGKYYVGDGHNRMTAALEIKNQTGNSVPLNNLLNNGRWTKQNTRPPNARLKP